MVRDSSHVVGNDGRRRTSLSAHKRALLCSVGFIVAVAGCGNNVGQARLTLVNANPHRITVHVPTGDGTAAFSVGGCETVDFTWDQGWRAVSGVSAPDAREPQVFIYSGGPANDQALPQYLDIVTGTSYLEYRATDRPSMPVCDSPSDLAPSSG